MKESDIAFWDMQMDLNRRQNQEKNLMSTMQSKK